ncbi:hypothetical protein [Ruegeria arenilitoris]|uniref:hypothetical protein n=1 Tax=Ruegeria arenilitoris TaxID=1173585 RepID=UPI001CFD77E8|nr:hypothetical protein [Ruegeria arenilitoris]
MIASTGFLNAFFALPEGTFTGYANGRHYVVSRSVFGAGRFLKLVAHQLGGPDYISMNLYLTRQSGALLRPCEMPADKVVSFVTALIPDT